MILKIDKSYKRDGREEEGAWNGNDDPFQENNEVFVDVYEEEVEVEVAGLKEEAGDFVFTGNCFDCEKDMKMSNGNGTGEVL